MTDPDLRALVQRLREASAYPGPDNAAGAVLCRNSLDAIESLLARAESAEEQVRHLERRIRDLTEEKNCAVLDKQAAEAECARLRQWLDNNTTFYDTKRIEDRTVLSAVSDRIWFHATDNTKDWPLSAVIDRAIAEGKHE